MSELSALTDDRPTENGLNTAFLPTHSTSTPGPPRGENSAQSDIFLVQGTYPTRTISRYSEYSTVSR